MTVKLDPAGFNVLSQCRTGPLLYNKNDRYIGRGLAKYGEFSFGEQELFRKIVRPGAVVVEVGANYGAHTVLLSQLVGGVGLVFAFEPQRLVFQTLCANLALNQCSNVYAYQVAVGAKNGRITVPELDPRGTGTSFGSLSLIGAPEGGDTPLVTVDGLGLLRCDLLKVDVEGMEIEVLTGALHTIKKFRPLLYLENDREDRSELLLKLVRSFDYEVRPHTPPLFNPDNFAGDSENIFENIVSLNILCLPSELQTADDAVNATARGVRSDRFAESRT